MNEYDYSVANIEFAINNANENSLSTENTLSAHRLIQINYDENAQSQTINSLTSDIKHNSIYNSVYDFTHRMNLYLALIEENLTDNKSILTNAFSSIELKSAIIDFQSNNKLLTLIDFNNQAQTTFQLLVNKIRESIATILNQGDDTVTSFEFNTSNIKLLLNSQNDNQNIENLEVDFQKFAVFSQNKIAKVSDILFFIGVFIEKLKNIKMSLIDVKLKTSSNSTLLKLFGNFSADDNEDILAKKQIDMTISPYMINLSKNTDMVIFDMDIQNIKNIYQNAKILMPQLIYDVSSKSQILKNIPLTTSGTNGKFASELNIVEQNNFSLTLNDIQNRFNLLPQNIISRKQLLQAIDYIFQYWIQNMSVLMYSIDICHINCHTNIASINLKQDYFNIKALGFITVEAALHYTTGCGCSIKLSYTNNNIGNLIPKEHRSDDTYFYGDLSSTIIIGGYKCNAENSPTSIHVNIGSFSTDLKNNRQQTISTPIPYKNKAITITATKGTPPEFCIKVIVKIPYKQLEKNSQQEYVEKDLGITDIF